MFEELFHAPLSLRLHRMMPMTEERIQFLTHLKNQGYAHISLATRASLLLSVVDAVDVSQNESLSSSEIANRVEQWVRSKKFRNQALRCRMVTTLATQWVSFLGKLKNEVPGSELPPTHFDALGKYLNFLKNEKNAKSTTVVNNQRMVSDFLWWVTNTNIPLRSLTIQNLDEFIKFKGSKVARRSMATIVSVVKSFLIYCERNRICRKNLSIDLHGPRIFRFENLPLGPSWASVQKLLSAPNLKTDQGKRDRAILLLLAIYGLRSSEVVALKLEDIDWAGETVKVVRAKNGRQQVFPLTKEVGEAIILYLKEARPKKDCREIFLSLKAPFMPMVPSSLNTLTKKYYSQTKIQTPHRGPHSLRHACASNLINNDVSLKGIADQLGHVSMKSVRTYAKVDLKGLREVGEFDLGELA